MRVLTGREAFLALENDWERLADAMDAPVFQRHAWARIWLDHLGYKKTPVLLVNGDPINAICPLVRSNGGRRLLPLQWIGHGVSDYLGPLAADPESAGELALGFIQRMSHLGGGMFQSIDLATRLNRAYIDSLGPRILSRPYEQCPVIDTTGSWNDFLSSKPSKFRTNYKRMLRKVNGLGEIRISRAEPDESLFLEMLEVERNSWKWSDGSAFLRDPKTRSFMRSILLEAQLPVEVWTCRVDDQLGGFAVCFTTAKCRQYYLPSFRKDFWGLGVFLMASLIELSCSQEGIQEFDFLRGDEAYKIPWSTGSRWVHDVVVPGGGVLGRAPAALIAARWKLAESEMIRKARTQIIARWGALIYRK